MTGPDLEMCAVDLAATLDRYDYADVCSDAILPELPAFLAKVKANQERLDKEQLGPDRWPIS